MLFSEVRVELNIYINQLTYCNYPPPPITGHKKQKIFGLFRLQCGTVFTKIMTRLAARFAELTVTVQAAGS